MSEASTISTEDDKNMGRGGARVCVCVCYVSWYKSRKNVNIATQSIYPGHSKFNTFVWHNSSICTKILMSEVRVYISTKRHAFQEVIEMKGLPDKIHTNMLNDI